MVDLSGPQWVNGSIDFKRGTKGSLLLLLSDPFNQSPTSVQTKVSPLVPTSVQTKVPLSMIHVGYSSPTSDGTLQVIPSLNLHFHPEDNSWAALEVSWLGWGIWCVREDVLDL